MFPCCVDIHSVVSPHVEAVCLLWREVWLMCEELPEGSFVEKAFSRRNCGGAFCANVK